MTIIDKRWTSSVLVLIQTKSVYELLGIQVSGVLPQVGIWTNLVDIRLL